MNRILANYHTHTFRCGHAVGEDKEYIEAALNAGLKVLGFSDHTPMPFPSGHHSGHRVPLDKADDYFYSLSELKKEYKNDIEIHIGVETEYYPETFDLYCEYMSQFPCEYMILGQHFLWREEDGISSFHKSDDPEKLRSYFKNVLQAVKTGKFLYIAHPDVINYTGDIEIYNTETRNFLKEIKKLEIPIEINCLGLSDDRHYPNKKFFKIAAEIGNRVVVGIDAHSPELLSCKELHSKCIDFAKQTGIEIADNNYLQL